MHILKRNKWANLEVHLTSRRAFVQVLFSLTAFCVPDTTPPCDSSRKSMGRQQGRCGATVVQHSMDWLILAAFFTCNFPCDCLCVGTSVYSRRDTPKHFCIIHRGSALLYFGVCNSFGVGQADRQRCRVGPLTFSQAVVCPCLSAEDPQKLVYRSHYFIKEAVNSVSMEWYDIQIFLSRYCFHLNKLSYIFPLHLVFLRQIYFNNKESLFFNNT